MQASQEKSRGNSRRGEHRGDAERKVLGRGCAEGDLGVAQRKELASKATPEREARPQKTEHSIFEIISRNLQT